MAVYCEPWLPSERISRYVYLQKLAAKSQSRSHVAARCNSYPHDANVREASAAGSKRGTSADEASTNKTVYVAVAGRCMIMMGSDPRIPRQQGGPPARGRGGGGRGRAQRGGRGRGARGCCGRALLSTRVLLEYRSLRRRRRENLGHLIPNFRAYPQRPPLLE
jgi:hypothetical protein